MTVVSYCHIPFWTDHINLQHRQDGAHTATTEDSTGAPQKLKCYPNTRFISTRHEIGTSQIPAFIVALFTIVKIWNQPKCLLMDESINKMWDIDTMEYYSAIKNI
jgi:hypothetical protein